MRIWIMNVDIENVDVQEGYVDKVKEAADNMPFKSIGIPFEFY